MRKNNQTIKQRLAYLRKELRAERISYGELAELQSLADHIEPGDVELLEAAGVPEFKDEDEKRDLAAIATDLLNICRWGPRGGEKNENENERATPMARGHPERARNYLADSTVR